MTDFQKITFKLDWVKIIALIGCTYTISAQVEKLRNTLETNTQDITQAKNDIKEIQKWRTEVTAYYLPKTKTK